jgi:hypothetical protein
MFTVFSVNIFQALTVSSESGLIYQQFAMTPCFWF